MTRLAPDVGRFFTPTSWAILARNYIAEALKNPDWENEHYIWDCTAGTGNLLTSLKTLKNTFASTLLQEDVETIKHRFKNTELNQKHVFQLDILRDTIKPQSENGKIPDNLYKIIQDDDTRRKLIIFINPPFHYTNSTKLFPEIRDANREIQLVIWYRLLKEFPNSIIASFGKIRFLTSTNYKEFRELFHVKHLGGFITVSTIFQGIKVRYPVGFMIMKNDEGKSKEWCFDIISAKRKIIDKKCFNYVEERLSMNRWLSKYRYYHNDVIGYFVFYRFEMHYRDLIKLMPLDAVSSKTPRYRLIPVHKYNFLPLVVAFAVIKSKPYRWYDDADQFYAPKDGWQKDVKFIRACIELTQKHKHNLIKNQIESLIDTISEEEETKIINRLGFIEFRIEDFVMNVTCDEDFKDNLLEYICQRASQEYYIY